ncbi:MAG: hypothetical protein E7534_02140 [Ruminococcaceae bacterium]|nr:hypothetical protein [Oscillospiraceae bacterium]MBQ2780173.1 metallophosphoesterase [Clostridia bacterium]MBQ7303155.1 metallophosphoesterase [Clostridia bacterium]
MVYVTGDTHGDPKRLSSRGLRKLKKGDTLIICGDFGYIWNGDEAEAKLLKKWGKKKYTVAFLDGAHENFDRLESYPLVDWHGGTARQINENLFHLQRGEIYEIDGRTFFVMGGSEAPEREFRKQAGTWWEQEMPSEAEMRRACERLVAADNTVDFVITHEPSGKAGGRLLGRDRRLNGVHVFLSVLEDVVTFRHWYFGALHIDRAVSRNHTAVFQEVLPVEPPTRHSKK